MADTDTDAHNPMTIVVHGARCLPEVQLFGSQNPYVIAMPLPSRAMQAETACVVAASENDGVNPSWDAPELANHLTILPEGADDKVRLEVCDKRMIVDASIGFVDINIGAYRGGRKRLLLQLEPGGLLEVSVIDGDGQLQHHTDAGNVLERAAPTPVLSLEVHAAELATEPAIGSQDPYVVATLLPNESKRLGVEALRRASRKRCTHSTGSGSWSARWPGVGS